MSRLALQKGLIVSLLIVVAVVSLLLPAQAYYLNASKPITKGSNGYSCIYLLTFKHESLMPYLKTKESKKGLYLIDLPFIERNPDVIELLVEENHAIGLITASNTEQFNVTTFNKELDQFTEKIGASPLWATTMNGEFNEELLQASHAAAINMIAANLHFKPSLSPSVLPKGSFLFINGDQNFDFRTKEHIQLVTSAQVRSIEENVFNITTNEKDLP